MKKEVQGSSLNLLERKIMASKNSMPKYNNVKSHLNFVYVNGLCQIQNTVYEALKTYTKSL
jgi:hypothetical protein|nr:MAG TPA: hypothetical protein [Bacteriophage sp.]